MKPGTRPSCPVFPVWSQELTYNFLLLSEPLSLLARPSQICFEGCIQGIRSVLVMYPGKHVVWSTACFLYMLAMLLTLADAQIQTNGQGNFTSVGDAFWQLLDLKAQPDSYRHRRPSLGGQNFTHCCLL